MTSLHHRHDTCRLCGSRDLAIILPLPATPAGDHYVPANRTAERQPVFPMDVHLCRSCGLAQLLDVVAPDFLYGAYTYRTSISLGLTDHFESYVQDVLSLLQLPPDSLVVDIGSNDGTFLRFFRKRGCKVLGVDPATDVARDAIEAGIPTLNRFFDQATAEIILASHGPARVITANNVFANIDDLDSLMKGIATLLAPDGAFVFETGYWPDLVRNKVIDNVYHEHLSYFAVAPLAEFFRRHGLVLAEVRHSGSKGGSIRGIVRPAAIGAAPSATVEALLAQEAAFGLKEPITYAPLAGLLAGNREKLLALAADCRTQGKTLAGYGASVGVTTLIYTYGLGPHLQFLMDDNPIKQSLFSPGQHLPVLSSLALYERKPDYAILFPWRYADPIIAKHRAFIEAGGKFVLPLPDFRIL